jgi:DNA-binding SARP family transcriptional activator
MKRRIAVNPDMPSREIEAKVAVSMTGALIFRCPDHPGMIREWLDRALALARQGHDQNLKAQILGYALQYYSSLGDTTNNDAILYEMRSMPTAAVTSPMAVITLKWMEAVSCNWCKADPDTALHLIDEGLAFAADNGVHSGDHFLFTVGAYSALLKGEMVLAGDFLRRTEETLDSSRFHGFCQYNYITSLYHLIMGDIAAAQQYAQRALKYALETGIYFPVLFCRLGLAHILVESGDLDQAALHLAEVEGPVRNTESGILEYSWLLAKTGWFLATGNRDQGLACLRRALRLARRNGYTWLFWWWHPKSMARLYSCALEAGIEVAHVQKIIRTCGLSPNDLSTAPDNWPFPLEVSTMGRFEIVRDGIPLRFPGKTPRKPLEMLKALITLGGVNIREEQLSEILWPEADGDAAHKSFEVNLVRLRKLLGGPQYISYQGGLVNIERTSCRIDALVLEQLLLDTEKAWARLGRETGEENPAEAVRETERAVDLYTGYFLPADTQQSWTVSCRERLRRKTLQLLIRLGTHLMHIDSWEKALSCFQRGLEIDDLSESVYQNLMICRHRLGQKAEAVTTYHRCCDALSDRLGIQPSLNTEKLYREIAST